LFFGGIFAKNVRWQLNHYRGDLRDLAVTKRRG
jgi:hypothetical protein